MRKTVLIVFLSAALGAARPALAVPVTWELTGVIDATQSALPIELASHFPMGSVMTWTWTFDSDWPELFCTSDTATYQFPGGAAPSQFSWAANIGGHRYGPSSGPTQVRVNSDGRLGFDTSLGGAAVTGDMAGVWRAVALDVGLFWPSPLGSVDLPRLTPGGGNFRLSLNPFAAGSFEVGSVVGTFTAVRSVPEPSTLSLLLGGMALGMLRRRARKRTN